MKTRRFFYTLLLAVTAQLSASAQYSDIINGIANVLNPALSRSQSYKGFVEADYTQGFGNYRTNFATLSTSQGYQFSDYFYMGAGIGVDLFWSTVDEGWGNSWKPQRPDSQYNSYTSAAVMIPVFTNARLTLGDRSKASFFADLKVGAAFLCTSSYVKIRDGYLTNTNYFYLQPSVGVRIPVNKTHPRQAVNIGLHYRLITSDYWSGYQATVPLNGAGLNASFEW